MVKRLKKKQLRGYQVWMCKQIKKRKTVLLAVDMGLGKTAAVLTSVRRLLNEFAVLKVLIIAPKHVAEMTWPEEFDRWEHLKYMKFAVAVGTPKQRLAAINSKHKIHIINRENVPWLWRTLGKKWDYDMIVYDESSRLKAGKKRTKGGKKQGRRLSEFGALANARHLASHVVEMTGTVAPNGLIDLWGQLYILDLGERLGGTKAAFLSRWFNSDYMGYTFEPKEFAFKQIMRRIKDVMVSLRAEDHLELPPIVNKIIKVKLPPKVMKEYKLFKKTLVSEAYDVEAVSKGVLTNKLLQFANGSMYQAVEKRHGEKPERKVVKIHDEKLKAFDSIVAEAGDEQLLVAYGFKFDLAALKKKYPYAVVAGKDKDWKKKWDNKTARILLAHPAQIGHGMNLQFGGHILVWYGLTWSLELYLQFCKRLPRSGQESSFVSNIHILAEGTEDMRVLESMVDKNATQDKVTNAVRHRVLTGK